MRANSCKRMVTLNFHIRQINERLLTTKSLTLVVIVQKIAGG